MFRNIRAISEHLHKPEVAMTGCPLTDRGKCRILERGGGGGGPSNC